jgi:hypothetical protein
MRLISTVKSPQSKIYKGLWIEVEKEGWVSIARVQINFVINAEIISSYYTNSYACKNINV